MKAINREICKNIWGTSVFLEVRQFGKGPDFQETHLPVRISEMLEVSARKNKVTQKVICKSMERNLVGLEVWHNLEVWQEAVEEVFSDNFWRRARQWNIEIIGFGDACALWVPLVLMLLMLGWRVYFPPMWRHCKFLEPYMPGSWDDTCARRPAFLWRTLYSTHVLVLWMKELL